MTRFQYLGLRRRSPFNIVAGLTVVLVSALLVYPLGRMFYRVLIVNGALSFDAFSGAFHNKTFIDSCKDTAFLAISSTLIALVIAIALGVVQRED